MEKLITKTDLAKRAGVHVSTVMRFCEAHPEVEIKKKVRGDHPLIVEFLAKKTDGQKTLVTPGGTVLKIDDLYDDVAKWCASQGTWTAYQIRKHFVIGKARADRIFNSLYDAGVRSGKPVPQVEGPTEQVPRRKVNPGRKSLAGNGTPGPTPPAEYDPGLEELPGDIRVLMDWPLNKIIARFGTATGLEMYLKASKTVEEIAEKRAKNAKMYGELIEREIVRRNIFEPLNNALARMLRDGSRSVTSVITQRVKAGDTPEQCEAAVMKQLSAFIKPLKKVLGKGIFIE